MSRNSEKESKDFTVRRLELTDFDQFSELFEEVDRLHREALPEYFKKPETPVRTPEIFSQWLSDSNTVIFGAVNDGNLIGSIYVLFKSVQASPLHVPRSIGLIDVLVVAPEFRSVGVGAALVKEAQQWAKKKGANQMEINVWEFNSSALEFYENQGYRTFSRKLSLSI